MSKNDRQTEIMTLIRNNFVETQGDLVDLLKSRGYNATQATVSRDIKEMNLVKIQYENGGKKGLRYAVIPSKNPSQADDGQLKLLKGMLLDATPVNNFIVLKTKSGSASGVAAIIDETYVLNDKLGSIAGDDTILVIMDSAISAELFAAHIKELLNGQDA